MRVLWYLPANLIKGVIFEGVIVFSSEPHKGSTIIGYYGTFHQTSLIKYSLYEVCWKVL
jgi:hypothetical protein